LLLFNNGCHKNYECEERRSMGFVIKSFSNMPFVVLAMIGISGCAENKPGTVMCWEKETVLPVGSVYNYDKYSSASEVVCVPVMARVPQQKSDTMAGGSSGGGFGAAPASGSTSNSGASTSSISEGASGTSGGTSTSVGPDGATATSEGGDGSSASAGFGNASVADGTGTASAANGMASASE
jgi:hypothetical protein